MRRNKKLTAIAMMLVVICAMAIPSVAFAAQKVTVSKGKAAEVVLYADSATQNTATVKVKGQKAAKGKWSTSKKKVATVKKGKIVAKKAGKTTVAARYGKKKYVVKVTVKQVSISQQYALLAAGDTLALSLDGDVVAGASSSDQNVASVTSDGVVTAKQAGFAAVTLTSKKGKGYSCGIMVSPSSPAASATVDVVSVSFAKEKLTMTVGDDPVANAAQVSPDNATNKAVSYKSADESVATVDWDGAVTPVGVGKTIVSAASADGGKIATCEIVVEPYTVRSVKDLEEAINRGVKYDDIVFVTDDGRQIAIDDIKAKFEEFSESISPDALEKIVDGASLDDLKKLSDKIPVDDLQELAKEIPLDKLKDLVSQVPSDTKVPDVTAEDLEKIWDSILEKIAQYANGQSNDSAESQGGQ